MGAEDLLERMAAGCCLESEDAALVVRAEFEPVGGTGTKLMPPTYGLDPPYVFEERVVGGERVRAVLLDSFQSEANRVEEALLAARQDGKLALPLFVIEFTAGGRPRSLTSLQFPHRYADAYLRDSMLGGVRFDHSEVGQRLRAVDPVDARALYELDPGSLLFGAWDSWRKGRQTKFARVYRSELIGLNPVEGRRRAGRMDPFNLVGAIDDKARSEGDWHFVASGEKAKGHKLSEIGHGNVAPSEVDAGGVTIEKALRLGSISFSGLSRVRFGDAPSESVKWARAALAALALVGDRLAFGAPALWLRSGCDLALVSETIGFQRRGGDIEPVAITVDEASALFDAAVDRASNAGLAMSAATIALQPTEALQKAVEFAFTTADMTGE